MVEDDIMPPEMEDTPERKRKRRWAKRLGWAIVILAMPLVLVAAFLSSPIGKRVVAEQIANVAPASGLRFQVGRIEGDIYGQAVLRDVVLSDPKGEFLTIPEVVLDWRPLAFLWSGIDVRELTARRGRLERLPELLPGDPDAPILPDFDIRVDRLALENFVIARGVAGERAATAELDAQIDIRRGRALIDASGRLGAADTINLLLDARPDGDRFDLALDYRAAADGPIAGLAGLGAAYEAQIEGDGTWTRWIGHAVVTRQREDSPRERVAAIKLTNNAGEYGALGRINPPLSGDGILGRAVGRGISLAMTGTFEESVFDGQIAAVTSALDLRGDGAVDLAGNRFDDFGLTARVRDPELLGDVATLENASLNGELDGPFRDLAFEHRLTVDRIALGTIELDELAQAGIGRFDGRSFTLPLEVAVARVRSGNELIDTRLVGGDLSGELRYVDNRLFVDAARVTFPELSAVLALNGNVSQGIYAVAGPVRANGMALDDIGLLDGEAQLVARFGSVPWSVRADLGGQLTEVINTSISTVAGNRIEFRGDLALGADQPLALRDTSLTSERLTATLDSRTVGDRTEIAGSGRHVEYGPFTIDAAITGDGPRAELVLADPFPAAGLKDVRLAIAPDADGFAIDTEGQSLLGPFDGRLGLVLPADAPTRIDIERLRVFETNVRGALTLSDGGIGGDLALSGGGLDGAVSLAPQSDGAQAFDLDLQARQARFAGETEIAIANADIDASGTFREGSSLIDADISGSGFEYGALSIAQFAASARVEDGVGDVTASIAGRRSDRFQLKLDGDIAPSRIALLARGAYGGRAITMPRRAVLTALDDGGWQLAPTQIGFAGGFAIVEGSLGGASTELDARLSRMPLRIADLAAGDLGLGGRLSGIVTWRQASGQLPTGDARVRIDDFTRSGLILSSTPIDVLAVANLTPDRFTLGARLREDGEPLGRLDTRITQLRGGSDLVARILNGRLDARFAYDGGASALWRLAAIETFDLTGPVSITARATRTLANPQITGNVATDDLRLQSAVSGTDITGVEARGRFVGSRLELTRFAGSTRGDGRMTGSGTVDFAAMGGGRGPRIDLRAAASNARLIAANGLDATITGPLRIVSDGVGGTIAGRVAIDRASWKLGVAAEDMSLPRIATTEINRLDTTRTTSRVANGAWRYLINASAPSRVEVDGLGLNSEWGINIALRGTVDDPRLGGEARLVRGTYSFAGTRFDLTEGQIDFDANLPIDPRLDIEAETNAQGTDVAVSITGNAQSPEVAFSSEPALPEEEILAQLLFGGSVTSLSATDAVQLGAALASLRGGGGGIDPIGQLRNSIGLDQLRIVSADPALGRETGVALGKNLGRRVYVEIVTDGRGYSATSVEYRVTRWLALLGTVTTIGRDSVLAEVSRDY